METSNKFFRYRKIDHKFVDLTIIIKIKSFYTAIVEYSVYEHEEPAPNLRIVNVKNLVTFTEPRFIYGGIWYNDGSIFLSLYMLYNHQRLPRTDTR